jgi:hypothetical protein
LDTARSSSSLCRRREQIQRYAKRIFVIALPNTAMLVTGCSIPSAGTVAGLRVRDVAFCRSCHRSMV